MIDLSKISNGIVLFTFDDGWTDQWLETIPLFQEFNAHATFFYPGDLPEKDTDGMKKLMDAGHSVGLHALKHLDADICIEEYGEEAYLEAEIFPQLYALKNAGIKTKNFAYPNNLRNEETDKVLLPYFKKFRAGLPSSPLKGYDISSQPDAFMTMEEAAKTYIYGGCGIGEFYLTKWDNLERAMLKASKENLLLTFFSHGISENPNKISMKTTLLRQCLELAADSGLTVAGFDDLPCPDPLQPR